MLLPPEDLGAARTVCVDWKEFIDADVLGNERL